MNYQVIIMQSMLWSLLWIIMVSISVRVFPHTIEHDYPDDVRKTANIPELTAEVKKKGLIFAIISFTILIALLLVFAIFQYKGSNFDFVTIFIHLWIICIFWNFTDLIIVDWLFICLLNCKYFVLPGTEDCKGNKNYFFHFVGFLKGAVAMTVVALIFSAIAYFILTLKIY